MPERHACLHCDKVFRWGADEDSAIVTLPGCGENAAWKLTAHMESEHRDKMFVCGRQNEGYRANAQPAAYWGGDGTCSYCGSISEEAFFAAVEAGAEVGPTDKSYKAYIDLPEPNAGTLTIYSSANHEQTGDGWEFLTAERAEEAGLDSYAREHYVGQWVVIEPMRAVRHGKFYFQHLSESGRDRFIEMVNAKTMKIGMPGHFYSTPYFCQRKAA